jgi:hypothetical protein
MATTTYTFPNSAVISSILQDKLPARLSDLGDDALLQHLPMQSVNAVKVIWEQLDNYQGTTQIRGYGVNPVRIARAGINRFNMDPGVYGDSALVDEEDLTVRREMGTFGLPVKIDDLVMERQDALIDRFVNFYRLQAGMLFTQGQVTYGDGKKLNVNQSFPLQTFTAIYPWSNTAQSTPLADLRALALLQRGHSVDFGQGVIMLNRSMMNYVLANTNAADLGGKRQLVGMQKIGGGILNVEQLNFILQAENLPTISIYDKTYYPVGSSTPTLFIPDGKAVVIGRRDNGEPLARFLLTRNAKNMMPADGVMKPFENLAMQVINKSEIQAVPEIEVSLMFNGGPAIYFPSGIVKMSI